MRLMSLAIVSLSARRSPVVDAKVLDKPLTLSELTGVRQIVAGGGRQTPPPYRGGDGKQNR